MIRSFLPLKLAYLNACFTTFLLLLLRITRLKISVHLETIFWLLRQELLRAAYTSYCYQA